MRLSKLMLNILILCGVIALLSGCASKAAPTPAGQLTTVQRGNLSTGITGVGNLALSQKVDLPFELDGTVEEVLVQEAESVEEGQELARLDTSAWQDQVTTLERQLTQAERQVTQAERQVTSRQRDVLQAQINLNNAQLNLESTEQQSTDPLEIQMQELQVELTEGKLEDARIAVQDAEAAVGDAQAELDDAQQALVDAQKASPEVKAPFAGFITSVNVAGGDEVKKGTVAMTIADPTKFEADVMVSEINILKVALEGVASVQVEAMPGVSFPATVSEIAPSATIQSGVVNYKVKVTLTSLQPIISQQQPATGTTGNTTAGAFSGRTRQGFAGSMTANATTGVSPGRFGGFTGGNLTQEQIDQMRQQRQTGQGGGQQSLATGVSATGARLAEGMTVTVSITTQERSNVLLVPVQAVISQGGETIVQVATNGVTEDRPVQVGLSNWQYAEITSGLSEGEQVIVPQLTAPTTSPNSQTTQQGQRQQGGVAPNLQRILR